jgi:hypothetical protein
MKTFCCLKLSLMENGLGKQEKGYKYIDNNYKRD